MASVPIQQLSIVVPVYRGEKTLRELVRELAWFTRELTTAGGRRWRVCELILVHDCGPDDSASVIADLVAEHPWVRAVWLSRNFGQHAATLAGMASAVGDWVATMDEDLQHDPSDLDTMLETAVTSRLQVVYAAPRNAAPHGWKRNLLSTWAKRIGMWLQGGSLPYLMHSYRLVDGEIARNLAAFCGKGVYLDVALLWVASAIGTAPVTLREERGRPSGYTFASLVGHFWSMILTSGPRPLRIISLLGAMAVLVAVLTGGTAIVSRLLGYSNTPGWASLLAAMSFFSGCILLALGTIAEYLAMTAGILMGRPLYVVLTRPARSVGKP
jgi:glycosyltransferase involved in cell wall biosynthesis